MPAIRYEFTSVGADAVKRDFAGIASEAKAFQRTQQQTQVASRRVGSRTPEAMAAKQAERAATQAAKATERAEQQKTRAAERGAKEREKIAEREAKAKVKAEERAYKAMERDVQRAYAADVRAQKRAEALRARAQEKRANKARSDRIKSDVAMGSAIGALLGGVAERGLDAVIGVGTDSARFQLENKQKAIALSKAGRLAGQTAVSPDELLREAKRTAGGVTGTKVGDVLDAQQRYVSMTGDMGQARSLSRTFAVAARATGSRDEDIASTAATLRDKFGVTSQSGMQDALAKLIFQGKSGAFELSDASRYFTEMGAAGSRFGLDKGAKGVATLGGLAQISRMSTGSGAEASTAVQAMLRQLVAQSDLIKRTTGAKVFTDSSKTKTRDVQDVLVEVVKGSKGNLQKLQKIFGEEGIKGLSKMITTFNEAQGKLGPKAKEKDRLDAGEKALRGMFDEAINAGGTWSEVMKDAAAQSQSAIDQWDTALEKAKGTIGEALEPSIEKLAANLGALDPVVSQLAGALGDGVAVTSDFALNIAKLFGADVQQPKERTVESALNESRDTRNELGDINAKEKRFGKLTNADKRRKMQLEDKQLELSQFLADHQKPAPLTAVELAKKGQGVNRMTDINLSDPLLGLGGAFGTMPLSRDEQELRRQLEDTTPGPKQTTLAEDVANPSWWDNHSVGRSFKSGWRSFADTGHQEGSILPGIFSWAGGPNAKTVMKWTNEGFGDVKQAKAVDVLRREVDFSAAINGLVDASNRLSGSADKLGAAAGTRRNPGEPE